MHLTITSWFLLLRPHPLLTPPHLQEPPQDILSRGTLLEPDPEQNDLVYFQGAKHCMSGRPPKPQISWSHLLLQNSTNENRLSCPFFGFQVNISLGTNQINSHPTSLLQGDAALIFQAQQGSPGQVKTGSRIASM